MIAQKSKDNNISIKAKISAYFNQNKRLIIAESIGLIFCFAMSFVFHFAYDWLGRPQGVAFAFATNESVWEHGKIIFYPFLIYSIAEFFVLKPNIKVFATAKCLPLVFCIPAMLMVFYTYSGIVGTNILAVDIIMTISIIFGMFVTSYKSLKNEYKSDYLIGLCVITAIILIMLIVFTYVPPHISLFF